MQKFSKFIYCFAIMIASVAGISAQTSADIGIKATIAGGDVTAIANGKISLSTKDGAIEVEILPATGFKRVPPENPSLKAAVDSTFTEIGVGDKLLVSGLVSDDKKLITAKTVYLMTKSSISEKLSKEDADWRARGMSGNVVSVDPMTNAITITVRGGMAAPARNVIVKPGQNTEYKRYVPDSIEFAKAIDSKISDIEKGDEIRVLGNKNADGSEVEAEKIITGGFKTTSGTVKAINLEKNEVTIKDVVTEKDVTVTVMPTSILKQFPPEMATQIARFQMMQAMGGQTGGMRPPTPSGQTPQGGGQTPPQGGGQTPPTNGQTPGPQNTQRTPGQFPGGGGGGMGGGMGGGGRGGFDDSRLPQLDLATLKVGDTIGVLSSKPKEPSKIRAIKLFNGVKPFIDAAQASAAIRGGGGQRGGGGGGFSIPGLDGFGN